MSKRTNGFTLLEILIALIIFVILAVITSTVLYSVFNARDRVIMHAERLAKLQIAMIIMQRDFDQCIKRPVNNNPEQQLKSPLIGNNDSVEFTSGGYVDPLAENRRSSLRRIAYLAVDHNLIRRTWDSLDSMQPNQTKDKLILTGVESLEFSYLDNKLNLLHNTNTIPKAVQINFSLTNWGKMSLLFLIPAGTGTENENESTLTQ